MKTHIPCFNLLLAVTMTVTTCLCAQASQSPNLLLITVDDMGYDSPGCYGGIVENITPHIDQLASEGIRFDNAHVYVAVCQPSRQSMMTGRYNHKIDALGFSPIDETVTTLQELLDANGYMNGILGKVKHLQPTHKYNWSYVKTYSDTGWGRDPDSYYAQTKEFIEKAEKSDKPFFLMANSHDPHRPFYGSAQEEQYFRNKPKTTKTPSRIYTPEEAEIPGFLPDVPLVRKEMAQYFSSVRRADDMVGAVLKALEDSGHRDNTMVVFMTDNGMPVATAKWNTYNHSTRTPWIIRWPSVVKPQSVDKHFISALDYMPTVLEILGITPPEDLDGFSFLPLLKGGSQPERDHVFTAHYQWVHYYGDKEARKENLEKMVQEQGYRYKDEWGALIKDMPIRCLQNQRFAYIYNQWADGKQTYFSGYVLTASGMKKLAKTDAAMAERIHFIKYRAPEEFYDLRKDPNSLNNLINSPEYARHIDGMRMAMHNWMVENEDPVRIEYESLLSGSK